VFNKRQIAGRVVLVGHNFRSFPPIKVILPSYIGLVRLTAYLGQSVEGGLLLGPGFLLLLKVADGHD
jgi:hypothetical protein